MTPSLTPALRIQEELQAPEPDPISAFTPVDVMPPNARKSAWSTFADTDRLVREGRVDGRSSAGMQRRLPARRVIAQGPSAGRASAAPSAAPRIVLALPLPRAVTPDDIDTGSEPWADNIGIAPGGDFNGGAIGGRQAPTTPPVHIPPRGASPRPPGRTAWPINRRVDTVLGEVEGPEAVTLRGGKSVSAIEATSDARLRTASSFPWRAIAAVVLLIVGLSLLMLPLNPTSEASEKAPRQRTVKSR